jgi:hypothetical protein
MGRCHPDPERSEGRNPSELYLSCRPPVWMAIVLGIPCPGKKRQGRGMTTGSFLRGNAMRQAHFAAGIS